MTIGVFLATATHQQHDKSVFPSVQEYTVVLSRNADSADGSIDSIVDFPLE